MSLRPCWSCGAQDEECFDPCECSKCEDPEAYDDWRENNPEEYEDWLNEQKEG